MNKTKLIKSFALGLFICLGVSSTNTIKSYATINDKQIESTIRLNTLEIQKTLYGYLSNKWEESQNSKIIENEYILSDSLQKKYDNLKSEYENKWRQEIDEKIQWYKLDLEINSIENINEFLKIDVIADVNFQYDNIEVTSGIKEHHIIYLKEENDKLLVERDIYIDDLSESDSSINEEIDFSQKGNFNKYINKKIEKVTSDLEVINDDINKYKSDIKNNQESLLINTRYYSGYNGSKAASWALNHVYDDEVWPGDNCTYFVSSALNAGGLPTDGTWYNNKYCGAWIRVIELRNWLLNKGYATETVKMAYGNEGDVIQLFNASKQQWSHSVIVTYTNHRYGNCYVSAHSNKAYNVSIRNYYPSSTYSNARTLKLS